MHFQKSARQWWASLRANGEAPKTWKALRASKFLASDAKDKVLTEWRSLKLSPYESIHKYVDKFWDLHLKATVYKKIDFEEKKQQFCAGLPEDMNEYVNPQRLRSILAIIHHTMVAARINFQQGAKRNLKPMEAKEKQEYKGKNFSQNSSKGNSNNNKAKEKGVFKGKNKLTPEELERYRKENKCFKCGEQGHSYRSCPQRNPRNEQPRASMVEAPKEEVHCKGSPLSYGGKVREHDAFILFDPGSTHNFISLELATKLGVQDFEMGDAMKADGAFINQEVSVTPLIGKVRLHIQGYVDKEDFFISPLKHEDVILGAPWFDCLAASIKFPERKISFKFREKDMYINAQESGSSIPLVNDQAFDKSIKSSVSAYMILVEESLNGVDETQVNENGMQVDLELSSFLNQFQDVFINDIPGELPPKRGNHDHMIELIPGSSPPNKPPDRVSQAQQEEIMRQVNGLVEKGMVRHSSSPFCSPVLLVQNKDDTYRMCVDYRALNRITIKNRFLVPRVEDLFDKLQSSTYFSRIDLKSGYHQIRIVDEDIVKTAFRTMFGLYEYLVMPFGLTNALATFNRMMERIFRPHRNFTGVFFDEVIIYSKTIDKHKEHLKVIFQALRDNKLYVNQKKSEFFLQEIQYLGHIISILDWLADLYFELVSFLVLVSGSELATGLVQQFSSVLNWLADLYSGQLSSSGLWMRDDVTEEFSSSQGRQVHEVESEVFGIFATSSSTQQIGSQAQVMHTANLMKTLVRLVEYMESPRPISIVQEQAKMPASQALPIQPTTLQQPNVSSNGQGSSL
ncbi:hypothetical protein L7F22_040356 [Adiantum nelumboides]|nr:hypothetical protein [Adiantum nelumboides]